MSVDILELEKAASNLFPNAATITDEATRRACTNRQYYITYHRLLQAIEQYYTQYDISDNGPFGRTGSHRRIYLVLEAIYKATKNRAVLKLSYKFDKFLSQRHKADYDLDEDFDNYDYSQILKFAEDIPDLVNTLIDDSNNNHLTKAAL